MKVSYIKELKKDFGFYSRDYIGSGALSNLNQSIERYLGIKPEHKPRKITYEMTSYGYMRTRKIPNCSWSSLNTMIKLRNRLMEKEYETCSYIHGQTLKRWDKLINKIAKDQKIKLTYEEIKNGN